MKKLIAMALVASLAFSSSVMVFAADETAPEAVAEVVAEAEVEEEVVEEVVAPVNVDFAGVTKNYYSPEGEFVAQYLVLNKNAALSKTMFNLVNDKYLDMLVNRRTDVIATNVALVIDFTVSETLTAAKIEYNLNTASTKIATNNKIESVVIATYYVDKAAETVITADEYAALVVAEEEGAEAVEEEVLVESVMLPLRAYAEGLGYVVSWNNGKITVTKGAATAHLETGSTTYADAVGDLVELAAPESIDHVVFVPIEFFTKVLYVEVEVIAE